MSLVLRARAAAHRRAARRAALVLGAVLFVSACAPLGLYRPGDADTPEVVNVVLGDASLDVRPSQIARGKIAIEILNQGELEHGLRIVGPGVDEQSDGFIVPGQRSRFSVKLGPGTYHLFCPDGNHAARGVSASLDVTDTASSFRR